MFDDDVNSGTDNGIRLNPDKVIGHLLMVWTIDYIPHSPTKYSVPNKPSDVVVVDVVDLDLPDENGHQGLVARRTWWRQSRLIRDLKSRVGRPNPILIRVGRDTSDPGANAPYILITARGDQDAEARAEAWMAAHPEFRPSTALEPMPSAPVPPPSYQQPVAVSYVPQYAQASAPASAPPAPPPPPLPPPPPPRLEEDRKTVLQRLAEQSMQSRGRYDNQHEDPPF